MADTFQHFPRVYSAFCQNWEKKEFQEESIQNYIQRKHTFIPNLLPEKAIHLNTSDTIEILKKLLGKKWELATSSESCQPDQSFQILPDEISTPLKKQKNTAWLKKTNMVGINVRTIGSFWNIIKYAMTLSQIQDSIHLLPIWEPGVVGSLYGMSSWQINNEFFSKELRQAMPHLDTVEKQLKAVINLLHCMGKKVGMDVIPHTDRFSEISLANPHYFEWLQREDTVIVNHCEDLHKEVQSQIMEFLKINQSANKQMKYPDQYETFFSQDFSEEKRLWVLFGPPENPILRNERRGELAKYLYLQGYEPVPATMAPPYRGLAVDLETKYEDGDGYIWRDYRIINPQSMSRVFGPLTRYKLYHRKNNNLNWEIDFSQARKEVWDYIGQKYYQVQEMYGFDFMRGDMSHVQMRPQGVPEDIDSKYDILKFVKNYIQKVKKVPYFGYFAETFIAPRNIMAYGDEMDHLEASDADSTLGDLQSVPVGSKDFLQRFRYYCDILDNRNFSPNFTMITGDKDDPRFDKFYLTGNIVRFFMGFFLTDIPSYMGLGFETRDIHHQPAPNEHYTKLFVFQEKSGPKATHGPYVFGKNGYLFHQMQEVKKIAQSIWKDIINKSTCWFIPPDATGENKFIAWSPRDSKYFFVANLDGYQSIRNFNIPVKKVPDSVQDLELFFSTHQTLTEQN
ncbi:MAG: hypothetical protein MJB14_12715, partial [Spirochaetes bacterium]|nr:hypothetical protein [Spirochaetota bacterium]